MRLLALLPIAMLAACGTDQSRPAVEIRTVTKTIEAQKPCPVTKPARPASLPRPLPTDATKLVIALTLKLAEWAGPGGYGERADSALTTCTASSPP